MTITVESTGTDETRRDQGSNEVSDRLIASAARMSRNAMTEIDWNEPLDPTKYGCSPEWSSLYGTDMWDELTEEQRIELTRHEFASISTNGIWFEMILQEMVIRDQYLGEYHSPEFQWSLVEIADECRHSLMFAKGADVMVGTSYRPSRFVGWAGKAFMALAKNEVAYSAILVAEEVLDVFQRGCMNDDRVLPLVRTVNEIHVLEESRHMKFAREEVRESMEGVGWFRRQLSALIIAIAGFLIVTSLHSPHLYTNAGLDSKRAMAAKKNNSHFKSMMRESCVHLMEFLDSVGLLTRPAARWYRKANLL
ncbi:AurF N-oxygenase family protein [Williamsia sp. MIQD14]|uniref:AurF N-oxygenase family protein n=1 Tax=Williamsia sp. MIQD14 TaxID=3425703 RepID=UPI003DA1B51A